MIMQTSSSSSVNKFEGPYGLVESNTLVPRWTYPIKPGQIRQVEAWELDTLPNASVPVRMVNDIHAIHSTPIEEQDDTIDLDAEAAAIAKTESRLLIKPKLNKIRARKDKDYTGPENVFTVGDEIIDDTLDSVDAHTKKFRGHFLRQVFSPLLGYDIAAGEAEAIARDCLETDLEIDSELVPYIERIGLANIIGSMLEESKSVPDSVRADVIKDWLIKSFDDIRAQTKGQTAVDKLRGQLRRLVHGNDDMIAKGPGIGSTRGFSDLRKQQRENGKA